MINFDEIKKEMDQEDKKYLSDKVKNAYKCLMRELENVDKKEKDINEESNKSRERTNRNVESLKLVTTIEEYKAFENQKYDD